MIIAADSKEVWDLLACLEFNLDFKEDVPEQFLDQIVNPISESDYTCVCLCLDCGYDLLPRRGHKHRASERYMVHNFIWAQTGLDSDGGELCVSCIERRLGRQLTPDDFINFPINRTKGKRKTKRLAEKITGETNG